MCLPHLQDVQDANLAGYNRILHLNATQLGTRVTVQYSRQHQAGVHSSTPPILYFHCTVYWRKSTPITGVPIVPVKSLYLCIIDVFVFFLDVILRCVPGGEGRASHWLEHELSLNLWSTKLPKLVRKLPTCSKKVFSHCQMWPRQVAVQQSLVLLWCPLL